MTSPCQVVSRSFFNDSEFLMTGNMTRADPCMDLGDWNVRSIHVFCTIVFVLNKTTKPSRAKKHSYIKNYIKTIDI